MPVTIEPRPVTIPVTTTRIIHRIQGIIHRGEGVKPGRFVTVFESGVYVVVNDDLLGPETLAAFDIPLGFELLALIPYCIPGSVQLLSHAIIRIVPDYAGTPVSLIYKSQE